MQNLGSVRKVTLNGTSAKPRCEVTHGRIWQRMGSSGEFCEHSNEPREIHIKWGISQPGE
jgi:hypothetical protein